MRYILPHKLKKSYRPVHLPGVQDNIIARSLQEGVNEKFNNIAMSKSERSGPERADFSSQYVAKGHFAL